MRQATLLLMGLVSFLLTAELLWSLLAHFQTHSCQLGASYIRWKHTPPVREYRLMEPRQLPHDEPVVLEITNADQLQQRWVLRNGYGRGHMFTLEVQASRIRPAGWHRYTFTILHWQMSKAPRPAVIAREYSRGPTITYLFFYDVSNQQVGYAVLYWRT